MKKFEIEIREFELNEEFEPMTVKRFRTSTLVDDDMDGHIDYICQNKCNEIRKFYVKEREHVPFAKIRRDYE